MRFIVIRRKHLFFGLLAVVLAVVLWATSGRSVMTFLVGGREIPIYSVKRDDNAIALTFDCAWNDDDIDEVIKILKDSGTTATFFVTGRWAEDYPESLNKLSRNGFEIGIHSYNHDDYTKMSAAEITEDMKKCDRAVVKATGTDPVLARVPSGAYNNTAVRTIEGEGRACIQWSVDGLDYIDTTVDEIYERIVPVTEAGDIILLHNGTKLTAAALPKIIAALKSKYRLVNVSDLIYHSDFIIDNTGRQCRAADVSI